MRRIRPVLRLVWRTSLLALSAVIVVSAAGAAESGVPGALNGLPYSYNDGYKGWPVAPVHEEHPVRSTFLDPRPLSKEGNYHIGIDINVRDDQPETGAPTGRTHRVYAIEGGTARVPANQAKVGCTTRLVVIGHFEYWHTDTVGVIANGDTISPGQMIGWTCKNNWHVHLTEDRVIDGVTTWVNPLHPAGKLVPYTDTTTPVVRGFRFSTPAVSPWRITNGSRWAPEAGKRLSPRKLRGLVDVRARIGDPMSFHGFLDELPQTIADVHPYRVRVEVRRLRTGRLVLAQDVFRSDVFFESNHPSHGTPIAFDNHYAPGTFQNISTFNCLRGRTYPTRPGCQGEYWFRLFARHPRAAWDTRGVPNGRYWITAIAWDTVGNRGKAGATVTIANPPPKR